MCRRPFGITIFQRGEMDDHWERRFKPIMIRLALIGFIIFLKEGVRQLQETSSGELTPFNTRHPSGWGDVSLRKILLSWIALHMPS